MEYSYKASSYDSYESAYELAFNKASEDHDNFDVTTIDYDSFMCEECNGVHYECYIIIDTDRTELSDFAIKLKEAFSN